MRGYHINKDAADLEVLVTETDAQVSLKTFQSELTPELDKGTLPPAVLKDFQQAGFQITPNTKVKTIVPGKRWSFSQGDERFIVALEPQYWERKDDKSIRFIKSLDHLWIYR